MASTENDRPDPDALLAQVREQERRAARGRLRIYFGASAGVGKTYAMLSAGRKAQADGRKVIVGIVETHGRSETAALVDGLDILPRKEIHHRGRVITEFDIDAALARQPELILVDELAHSNASGSRHPKRWQDIEELLEAGIDVYTTVNVQHLESLTDVVGGIAGIRVFETLPDKVFDKADEVVLVDLPADELLERLKAGKVYHAQQAERASKNFFRKGNLIALRELAMRRMADRIGDDVQAYRVEKSISAVWKTGPALLACVGADGNAEHVVRTTARMAGELDTEWHAVYVETPALQRLPPPRRERILEALQLAQELGARTAVLNAGEIPREIVEYARSQNLSRVVLGPAGAKWRWNVPHSQRISQLAPDVDLIITGHSREHDRPASRTEREAEVEAPGKTGRWRRYAWTCGVVAATAIVSAPLVGRLDLANIVMLFLLTEVLVAVRFGRGPAVAAAFLSVACVDFFFVSPRLSFAFSDVQYAVVFLVMLIVGLIVGQLTAGLRFQAMVASQRERRARALYEFARDLSGMLQTEQISRATGDFLQRSFRAQATLLLPDADGRLVLPDGDSVVMGHMPLEIGTAQWAFDHARAAGMSTDTLPGSSFYYLPLVAPMRTRGVIAIHPETRGWLMLPEQRRQLDTFATLAAIALERVHYVEVAQDALVHMESERLRNSLLSALSHDLRTPLTLLVGLSETLAMSAVEMSPKQRDMTRTLHTEAVKMSNMVANLLDMARIQSGGVHLNMQWQNIEEVVGSALRACAVLLDRHKVETHLPFDLPLVRFDGVLLERVLCNLIENAIKYTPPDSRIVIRAHADRGKLTVGVSDNGTGLPPGQEETIFEKFTRGEHETAKTGVGLGLAICRAIIAAHGGSIAARNLLEGGACIEFVLPLGTPPAVPEEPDERQTIMTRTK